VKKSKRLVFLAITGAIYLAALGWALVSGYKYFSDSREYAAEIKQKEAELNMVMARVKYLQQLKEEYYKYYRFEGIADYLRYPDKVTVLLITEALKAVIELLITKIGFERVQAKHDILNTASGKVMKKTGKQYEGRLRKFQLKKEEIIECLVENVVEIC
jgi:hypothetical protein